MKKFLIVLLSSEDVFITLVDPKDGNRIKGDNDKAIQVADRGQSFDSIKEVIEYCQTNNVKIVGEFSGFAY